MEFDWLVLEKDRADPCDVMLHSEIIRRCWLIVGAKDLNYSMKKLVKLYERH